MSPTPEVLELRVHGVSNTPPQDMLDLPPDTLVERGDDLGGFWAPKDGTTAGLTKHDRGWMQPGIAREAYSWGGMARTTAPGVGSGVARAVVAVAARIGWILLMPFGLVNLAFWSRIPSSDAPVGAARAGRRTMRVFSVVLTLLFTMTLVEIFVDIIASQCLGQPDTCRGLPTFVDLARHWSIGQRMAAAVVVVFVVLAGLAWLSLATNVRYETAVPPSQVGIVPPSPTRPLLSDRLFWARPRSKRSLLGVHVGMAATLVVLVLAWDVNLRADFRGDGESVTALQAWARIVWAVTAVGALLVFLYLTAYLCRLSVIKGVDATSAQVMHDNRPPKGWALPAAGITLVLALVAMLGDSPVTHGPPTKPAVMSSPGPVLLALVAIGLALAGSAWGFGNGDRPRGMVRWTVGALLAMGIVAGLGVFWGSVPAAVAAIVLTVVVIVAHVLVGRAPASAYAFAGRGAAVFMVVSLGFAVLLLSAATLAVGDWLNDCYTASDLTPGTATVACQVSVGAGSLPSVAMDLSAPAVFQIAAALLLPCVLGIALVVVVWTASTWGRALPEAPRLPNPDDADVSLLDPSRHAKRRFASYTARAEWGVALLAGAVVANLLPSVALAASAESSVAVVGQRNAVLTAVLSTGVAASAFVVLALVGALVGGATTAGRRPLGLVWDLVAFLPRDGHPLAPPCYAERAVPELSGRVVAWLDARDLPDNARADVAAGRRVILSGHSLGGVLCVAAILQLDPERRNRLSLMTYGSQLQAYFSRIFPSLLGPEVLGVHAISAPGFVSLADAVEVVAQPPWIAESVKAGLGGTAGPVRGEKEEDADYAARVTAWRDEQLTAVRWRNLWRATDPIGFPVDTGRWAATAADLGPVDYGCDEIDTSGYMPVVAGHSDYPRTPEYQEQLQRLATPTVDQARALAATFTPAPPP